MTDITKLLTEAGFKAVSVRTDQWIPYIREREDGRLDVVRVPYVSRPIEVCTWVTEANLSAVLLALQGRVALTEEERAGLPTPDRLDLLADWFDMKYPDDPNTGVQDDLRKWAHTLRNLLTRSATKQHHQEGES